jgi:hypothetical protein
MPRPKKKKTIKPKTTDETNQVEELNKESETKMDFIWNKKKKEPEMINAGELNAGTGHNKTSEPYIPPVPTPPPQYQAQEQPQPQQDKIPLYVKYDELEYQRTVLIAEVLEEQKKTNVFLEKLLQLATK